MSGYGPDSTPVSPRRKEEIRYLTLDFRQGAARAIRPSSPPKVVMQGFLSGIRMWFKALNIINRLSIGDYLSVKTKFARPRRPDCYFKYVLRSLFSADRGG